MTNFFDRLVARALGSEAIVHPRLPGLFEPLILEEAVRPTDPLHTEEIEGGVKPRAQAAGLLGTEATERLAVPARPDVSAPPTERSIAGKQETASASSAVKRRRQSSAVAGDPVTPRVEPPPAPSGVEPNRVAPKPIPLLPPALDVDRKAPRAPGRITPSEVSKAPGTGRPPDHAGQHYTPERTDQPRTQPREPSGRRILPAQEAPVPTMEPTRGDVGIPIAPERAEPLATPAAPTIRVTIGRVDVRAEVPPPTPRGASTRRSTAIALDDYLKQHQARRR